MIRNLRDARCRQFLDEMSRPMLYAIARGACSDITPDTLKEVLLDAVAELPPSTLKRGLAEAVAAPDLRALSGRFGYATTGSRAVLASRLLAAIDEPTARITRWRSFEDVRTFARSLQLTGQAEWFAFTKRNLPGKGELPDGIPMAPWMVYANKGWTNWGDFLGTDNPARRTVQFRPFVRARAYVRALGLANASEWRDFCRKRRGNRRVLPPDIPAAPDRIYAEQGWISFGDWLGNDHVHASKIEYRSYDEARVFVQALGIRNEPEWRAYCRGDLPHSTPRPIDIPTNPHRSYKGHGWVTWGHFLGTYSVAVYHRTFRSFDAARTYMRAQHLADSKEWRRWCAAGKRPPDVPASPDSAYRNSGWISWHDFLGNSNAVPRQTKGRRRAARRALRVT